MPNFDSDTVTAQELAASRSGKFISDAALTCGKLHFIQGKLTVPAGTAIADTFEIVKIPAGLTVIPSLSSVESPAQTASSTITLGLDSDPDALSTAIAMDAAGKKDFLGNIGNYVNSVDQNLIATLAGAALVEADVIYFNIVCAKGE